MKTAEYFSAIRAQRVALEAQLSRLAGKKTRLRYFTGEIERWEKEHLGGSPQKSQKT